MKFPTIPFVIITSFIVSTILVFSLFPNLLEVKENWDRIRSQIREELLQAEIGSFQRKNDYPRIDPSIFKTR